MSLFTIENDDFRFKELDLFVDDFIDAFPADISDVAIHDFSRNNMRLLPYWPSMATGFSAIEARENLTPDLALWIDATLLLSPKAFRLLGDLLSPCGEFLPIEVEGETYQIFNCLNAVQINANAQNELVCKPLEVSSELDFGLYCTERFKAIVHSFELQGIVFNVAD